MKADGLRVQCGLSEDETAQIHALERVCREVDDVDIKFNYSMIANRKANSFSDFCWYHAGSLVAYMPLDKFGSKGEITAAVLPDFRRQGIFTALYNSAVEQATREECSELLLVSYRGSESGRSVIKKLDVRCKMSEYCMTAELQDAVGLPNADIELIDVTATTVGQLAAMMAVNFPDHPWQSHAELEAELLAEIEQHKDKQYHLAQLEGQTIGHIGVLIGEHDTYVRAVGILPEWRRKGYGRQMLAEVLRRQLQAGITRFELDVETENEGALNIYTSCGFQQSNVYDYYTIFD